MALKIDAKCEGKLTYTFKNDMRNLEDFHRLKNGDFILESKMAELNQFKTKNIRKNLIDQMQCENVVLPWK